MRKRGRRINERKGVGGGESGSLDNFHNGSFRRRYPKFPQIVEYIAHLFADCRCQLLLYRQLLRSADGRKPKDSKRASAGILWSLMHLWRHAYREGKIEREEIQFGEIKTETMQSHLMNRYAIKFAWISKKLHRYYVYRYSINHFSSRNFHLCVTTARLRHQLVNDV